MNPDLRDAVMARANYDCARCFYSVATEAHRLYRNRSGRDDMLNLVALCGDCHRVVHLGADRQSRRLNAKIADDEGPQ